MENLAKKAKVEADGADHPVDNVNDGDFATRWNAKNDDVDTWIQFKWETAQKINRVHVTEGIRSSTAILTKWWKNW